MGKILQVSLPPRPKYSFKPKTLIKEAPVKVDYTKKSIEKVSEEPLESGEFDLNLCERKLYSLLYQYSERSFSKAQIGVFTGYSHKSGGFSNALSHLRALGLIEGSGNSLKIKTALPDVAQEFDFSKEAIISKLSKCEREIYQVLLEGPYDEFSKEDLALATPSQYSASSGGFSNAISRLNTLGLIERDSGIIKLNPELLDL